MALLILTRECYEMMREFDGCIESAKIVYVNREVITAEEASKLLSAGVNLTCFKEPIDWRNDAEVQAARDLIAKQHPGERIFSEEYRPGVDD